MLICCYVFIKASIAVILLSVRIINIFQIFISTAFPGDSDVYTDIQSYSSNIYLSW